VEGVKPTKNPTERPAENTPLFSIYNALQYETRHSLVAVLNTFYYLIRKLLHSEWLRAGQFIFNLHSGEK